jgi:hypothetical protein
MALIHRKIHRLCRRMSFRFDLSGQTHIQIQICFDEPIRAAKRTDPPDYFKMITPGSKVSGPTPTVYL